MKLNRLFRGPVTYLLMILVLVFPFFNFLSGGTQASPPKLSEVVDAIEGDSVQEATIEDRDQRITGKYKNGERFEASYTSNQGQSLFNLLRDKDVPVQVSNKGNNVFLTILVNFLPFV